MMSSNGGHVEQEGTIGADSLQVSSSNLSRVSRDLSSSSRPAPVTFGPLLPSTEHGNVPTDLLVYHGPFIMRDGRRCVPSICGELAAVITDTNQQEDQS